MKLLASLVVALAFPAAAFAEDVGFVTQEVPLHGARTLAVATPPAFDLVGLHWQGPGNVLFRTRSTSGRWSGWRAAMPEALDLPDANTVRGEVGAPVEARQPVLGRSVERDRVPAARSRHASARVFRAEPGEGRSRSHALDRRLAAGGAARGVGGERGDPPRRAAVRDVAQVCSRPPHRRRQQLHGGAVRLDRARDPGVPRQGKRLERHRLQLSRRQVRAGVRGPLRRAPTGTSSVRTPKGSTPDRSGSHFSGTYGDTAPTGKALDAIASLLAWRLDVAHVDPLSRLTWRLGRQRAVPVGHARPAPAISGHRDTGFTACPGNALYRQLPAIARKAAATRPAEALRPGRSGARRRADPLHRAALSGAPWSVRVNDATGATVAFGPG